MDPALNTFSSDANLPVHARRRWLPPVGSFENIAIISAYSKYPRLMRGMAFKWLILCNRMSFFQMHKFIINYQRNALCILLHYRIARLFIHVNFILNIDQWRSTAWLDKVTLKLSCLMYSFATLKTALWLRDLLAVAWKFGVLFVSLLEGI